MANSLKAGDVVELKSGGPDMTIEKIAVWHEGDTEESALCKWFAGTKVENSVFLLSSLKPSGG